MKHDLIKKEKKSRIELTILFSLITMCILVISIAVAFLCVAVFTKFDIIIHIPLDALPGLRDSFLMIALVSLIVGTGIAMLLSRIPLRPINRLITQMNRLASGDFDARISFGKLARGHRAFAEMEDSFNKMANELGNTEVLRSDFINNFSHEFKTPIVSIAGFAKLMQHAELSDAQKKEYIGAIAEESLRLSNMATNVLALTKVENQAILTDVTRYNLSEQIRGCVLLLEDKWMCKSLELKLDFDEYYIEANEQLLKQVFLNLVDNAVKFSPVGGELEIDIRSDFGKFIVDITNSGYIPEDDMQRIFNKFYQADKSHYTAGNGIGLAVAKKIVDLHGGDIKAACSQGKVTFTVLLPEKR